MRRLRTLPSRRLWVIAAAVLALAVTGGIAQAALSGSGTKPPAKPLDRAVYDAARAPDVAGISARVKFTNALLPGGSLPEGTASPLLAGATGRVWIAGDGRFRLELQSQAGDAQVTGDGKQVSVYDSGSNTVYRAALDNGGKPAAPDKAGDQPTLAGVRKGLADLAKTWTLSGAQPTTTAGRGSYTVRISPKDDGGLLGGAALAWDAAHGVPLRAAVYAQGQSSPVLQLEATGISYGPVASRDLTVAPPAGAKVVDLAPHETPAAGGRSTAVTGLSAVQQRLDFTLAAPDKLAGLPRKDVRLVDFGGTKGALSSYGQGLGGIVVLARKADAAGAKDKSGLSGLRLPTVNIDGASGTELATALGTIVTFDRGGVSYVVAGSVPPIAAENAARDLK